MNLPAREGAMASSRPLRIAVVATEGFAGPAGRAVESALSFVLEAAAGYGAEVVGVYRVPGLLEAPLVLAKLLERDDVEGAVLIGVVVRETSLEEYLFNQVVGRILELSTGLGKPVGLGVIGPGVSWDPRLAEEGGRAYGRMALEAVVKVARLLASLGGRG